MSVRRWSWLPAVVVALAGTAGLAGCGGGPTAVGVTLALVGGSHSSQVAPGETVTFAITVTDTGPSGTSGVTVSAHLPAAFRYTYTDALSGTAVRTSPVDPQVNSSQPQWGVWVLSGHGDTVQIEFTAVAGGQPGGYTVTADASGSTTSTTTSEGVRLTLLSAPDLSAQVSVSPNSASPGAHVTYQVTVVNSGTGPASGVEVMVTLPPVVVYAGGLQILGNSSRGETTVPTPGSVLPYFSGFSIPPHSGSAPGELELRFQARILTDAGALGTYPAGLQVIADANRYRVQIPAAAPLQIT